MDIPIIPVNPKNKLEEKITEIASMFDFAATKSIEYEDLGTVMRFLGCAPTEADLQSICKATEFENELNGNISIAKLIEYVSELLIAQKMKPADSNELLKAFQVLDVENTGYIDPSYFRELMLTEGDKLTENELNEMMKEAIDPETGFIAYEFYINKLVHKDKTAYEMGEAIYKERETIKMERERALAARRNLLKKA